jgi:hypothetical protein
MNSLLIVFARRENKEANQWLDAHPLVLGLMFLAIGGVIAVWGAFELKSGVARSKWGRKYTGGTAKTLAWLRIVAGSGFALFGLYKMVAG